MMTTAKRAGQMWLNTADSVLAGPRVFNLLGVGPAFSRRRGLASIGPMPETHHLSQDTYDRLSAELENLTTHGRTDIARKIQSARELGDLSENGDYHAAKEEQGKMESRIRHLTGMLENAEIVEGGASDVVQAGSVVAICYEGEDEPERFLIGSIEERHDDVELVISPGSPLGEQLMGKTVGDVVEYEAPGGMLKVEVVDIEG
jgi:transcription elongation factor GreA